MARKRQMILGLLLLVLLPAVTASGEGSGCGGGCEGQPKIPQTIDPRCHQDLTAQRRGPRESIRSTASLVPNLFTLKPNAGDCEKAVSTRLSHA